MMRETIATLEEVFTTHQRVVLWLSGGKDSLTLTHLCRPWRERLVILHNAMDTGFEGEWENLESQVKAWGFSQLLRTAPPLSYAAYVARYGWPVDVVPTAMDGMIPSPYRQEPKVSSWVWCSWVRSIEPLVKMTQLLKADAVLTAQRRSDGALFAQVGPTQDGRTEYGWIRYDPLYLWSTDDVYAYIETHRITLPPHYKIKRYATFEFPDCKACSWKPDYWAIVQKEYPEVYAEYWPQIKPVYEAVKRQLATYTDELTKGLG
jgi:3'-phosphoadenosine 5'-phosphosulfate sulfotransferase (PAPS reductase)/FAD synthetase